MKKNGKLEEWWRDGGKYDMPILAGLLFVTALLVALLAASCSEPEPDPETDSTPQISFGIVIEPWDTINI